MVAPSFGDILDEKGIFLDKRVLSPHYTPDQLLYRDGEITSIMKAVAPVLKGSRAKNLFIYGKTGTGKSASVRQVLQKLEAEGVQEIAVIYLNCKVYDSRYKVLQKCITQFNPDFAKTGYSFALLYEKLLDWVEEKNIRLILALDEIDTVKDLDNLVYTLTRANDDLGKGCVSLIGISNKINFKQRLDPRSKSSLCEEELIFQPYNAQQLKGILEQRVKKGFKPNSVGESALNLSSAIAASDNGDARYALLLLLRAGEIADSQKDQVVLDKHVTLAQKIADEDKAYEVISTLPAQQQILLYGLATLAQDVSYKRLVEDNGEKLYFSGEVYEQYSRLCKKTGREPRTSRWYREYLGELEMLGLISMVESGKGIRGHTTLIKLEYAPEKVKKAIEKILFTEN
ncbi:AAA family ATPase [Candidatus Micrarchaeota archaeon]|nr:AAA family ATPase [Candidatus Micrarchaeota archaeon]